LRDNISIFFFLRAKSNSHQQARISGKQTKKKKKSKIENIRKMKDLCVLPSYPHLRTLFFVAFVLRSKIIEVFIN